MTVGYRSVIRQRSDEYWAEAVVPRLFLLRQMPSAGLRVLVPHTIISLTLGLLPVGFVISTSILIGAVPAAVTGGVGSAQWHRMVTVFLGACAVFFAQQALTPLHSSLGSAMKHRVDGYFHDRVIAAATRGTGIGPLEDQESLARLREAVESLETGWRTPGDACAATFALVVRYVRLIGFGVVIAVALSWVWALGICAATMLFRYGHRGGLRIRMRMWPRLMDMRRESAYFRDIGLSVANAKEIRLLGLTPWVVRRYSESHIAYLGPMWRERRRVNVNRFLWFSVVGLLAAATVFILILRSAAQGEITLTQFSLGLQATVAVILLGEFYHEADDATQYGMEAVRALVDFEQRVDGHGNTVDATPERSGSGDHDVADLPRREIRLARVSFRYPGQMRPVLDGLDLTLRAGECTALVGLNGAGKTTLVKLLARLYEPDAGSVLVDGQDLRDLPVNPWRRQLAVIFQNFNRYQVSAADNIAFGAIDHSSDGAVRRAAEATGIAEILDALPRGFQSPLSRTLDGGADLSGGQWQRIAIARALYALDAGARVLILDEPTAALDVRAEARFFAELSALTRGVTSLLISHRFSSVRRADRIVVLEHGRIVEDGTHDSLMSGGGRYAELFHLQAERFRAGLDAEGDLAPRPADVNEDVP